MKSKEISQLFTKGIGTLSNERRGGLFIEYPHRLKAFIMSGESIIIIEVSFYSIAFNKHYHLNTHFDVHYHFSYTNQKKKKKRKSSKSSPVAMQFYI